MKLKKCLVCSHNKLSEFTNLGIHPLADTFVKNIEINKKIPSEKLICNFCKKCSHMQLKFKINADKRYNFVDYSYTSANSKVSRNYLKNYFFFIKGIKKKVKNIAEIGANDGYLISKFNKNIRKVCFEPSRHMDKILKKKNIINIKKFFEKVKIKKDQYLHKYFDLVIANNVLNHSDNPNKFFQNINRVLNINGIASIEVPYAPWMVKNKKFDLIYHEHVNYFSINSLNILCKKNNLFINKILFPKYHGKMIRIIISKNNLDYKIPKIILHYEKNIFKHKENFNKFIIKFKNRFLSKLKKIKNKKNNNIIVGISASTKANTFLNFLKLSGSEISCMTENSIFKIGKFTPQSFIEIKSDSFLKKITNKNIYVFFPTWNISSFLKKKILNLNKKIQFINV